MSTIDDLEFELACMIEDMTKARGLPLALDAIRSWCERFPEHTVALMERALWIVWDTMAPPGPDLPEAECERLVAIAMQALDRKLARRRCIC